MKFYQLDDTVIALDAIAMITPVERGGVSPDGKIDAGISGYYFRVSYKNGDNTTHTDADKSVVDRMRARLVMVCLPQEDKIEFKRGDEVRIKGPERNGPEMVVTELDKDGVGKLTCSYYWGGEFKHVSLPPEALQKI